LAQDAELREKASRGIKYDEYFNRRPEFQEYLDKMYQKYLRRVERYEQEQLE